MTGFEQPVSLAALRELGNLLVDVHGQRESISLLQPAYQLQLLDAYPAMTMPVPTGPAAAVPAPGTFGLLLSCT